jgi:hypothetical protein
MNSDSFYMNLESMNTVRNKTSDGTAVNVWDDAKDYLSANLADQMKEECMDLFQNAVHDMNKADDWEAQVCYIKGLGIHEFNAELARTVLRKLKLPEEKTLELVPLDLATPDKNHSVTIGDMLITRMNTCGRYEFSLTRKGVTKQKGLERLMSRIAPEQILLLGGDAENDLEMRDKVIKGHFPNAVFVATADSEWKLSKEVTGWDTYEEIASGGDIRQKQIRVRTSPLKPEPEHERVFPGFIYDAMALLYQVLPRKEDPQKEASGTAASSEMVNKISWWRPRRFLRRPSCLRLGYGCSSPRGGSFHSRQRSRVRKREVQMQSKF